MLNSNERAWFRGYGHTIIQVKEVNSGSLCHVFLLIKTLLQILSLKDGLKWLYKCYKDPFLCTSKDIPKRTILKYFCLHNRSSFLDERYACFGTGIIGVRGDKSGWRCYEQKDKRKVPPYRLKEWKDSDWVAMEDFILSSPFFSCLNLQRNTARDRKHIFLTHIHFLYFSSPIQIKRFWV